MVSAPAAGQRLTVREAGTALPDLALSIERQELPSGGHGCVIEVQHAAINPSDVKACLGMMPSAVFPRTTGRDFSGRVVVGPAHLVGIEVWGSGGDLGISRDGSHARYLWIESTAVQPRPRKLSSAEAAGVGVPFVTAMQGFMEAGGIKPGNRVLVLGANGKVGQAAVQIAGWHGAHVVAVSRERADDLSYIAQPFVHLDASADNLSEAVDAALGGNGAQIVFNTVGSPYWELALGKLAPGGCQIVISTIEREVPFDIFRFYRGRNRMVGVDTLALSTTDCGRILSKLHAGFDSRDLRPFPMSAASVVPLSDWENAFRTVQAGARHRMVFSFE